MIFVRHRKLFIFIPNKYKWKKNKKKNNKNKQRAKLHSNIIADIKTTHNSFRLVNKHSTLPSAMECRFNENIYLWWNSIQIVWFCLLLYIYLYFLGTRLQLLFSGKSAKRWRLWFITAKYKHQFRNRQNNKNIFEQ